MKKIITRLFIFIVLCVFAIIPLNTHALMSTEDDLSFSEISSTNLMPSQDLKYKTLDYVIDEYNVNIIVNENNTFDITETITAYFNVSKHGIIRNIPLKNTITRLDGTSSTNRAMVSNVGVDNEYTTSIENSYYKIKIGSPFETLTGEKKYVIKYTYNLGKDPSKKYDELYYNIIGTEWDTAIGNVSFTITMPKDFDSSKLGFSSGKQGSIDNDNITYNVDSNTITGSYNGILDIGEGLTIRCELPEGYFIGAGLPMNTLLYIMIFIPIIGLLISFILWIKYGKDEKIIETVEFYPPDGLNSLDVGFLYYGYADTKDVTSLLIYLANKGYLEICNNNVEYDFDKVNLSNTVKDNVVKKINELENKIIYEKKVNPNSKKIKYYENMLDIYKDIDNPVDYKKYDLKFINKTYDKSRFIIRKLKDYDGDNIHEQWFMEGLFKDGKSEVTDKMLYNKFYKTKNKILNSINNKQNKKKIIEKNTFKKLFIVLLMFISLLTITIIPTIGYDDNETIIFIIFIYFLYVFCYVYCCFVNKSIISRIIWSILAFFQSFVFIYVLPIKDLLIYNNVYFIPFVFGILCVIGMSIFYEIMPKRTRYGNEMLGKLRGFKRFLEIAKKEELEALIFKDPNYFYDILPFTYVLDVSDKWIEMFNLISLKEPSWYNNKNTVDDSEIKSFVNSTMDLAKDVIGSCPYSRSTENLSSSSSSGSSGGGTSGGGSGGGGGSSW